MKIVYWLLGVILTLGVFSCVQTYLSTQKVISLLEEGNKINRENYEIDKDTNQKLAYIVSLLSGNEITEILLTNDEE